MDSIHVAQSPAKQSAYLNSFSAKNPDNAEKGAGGTSGDTDTSWLSALDMSCQDPRIFKHSEYNLKVQITIDPIPLGSGSGFSMSVPAILFFGIVSVIGVFVVIAALVSSIHRWGVVLTQETVGSALELQTIHRFSQSRRRPYI